MEGYERYYTESRAIRDFLVEQVQKIRELISRGEGYTYGPHYLLKTSKGEEVNVNTVSFEGVGTSNLIFIPQVKNEIVGLRHLKLTPSRSTNGLLAKGSIWTTKRGFGFATALELCVTDYLQRRSQEQGLKIDWEIVDGNEPYSTDEERRRWLSLYGTDGVLGFVNKRKRIFPEDFPKPSLEAQIRSLMVMSEPVLPSEDVTKEVEQLLDKTVEQLGKE